MAGYRFLTELNEDNEKKKSNLPGSSSGGYQYLSELNKPLNESTIFEDSAAIQAKKDRMTKFAPTQIMNPLPKQQTVNNVSKTDENVNSEATSGNKPGWLKTIGGSLAKGVMNAFKGFQKASDLVTDKITEAVPVLNKGRWYDPGKLAEDVGKKTEDIDKWMGYENMSKTQQFIGDVVSSIPQMGTLFIPGLGPAVFGASAGGNYADDLAKKGATPDQQLLYGAIGGAAEVGLNKVLDIVPGYQKVFGEAFEKAAAGKLTANSLKEAGKFGKEFVKNMGREAIEEAAIDPVMGLAEKAIFDKDKKWFGEGGVVDFKQMGYDALAGAVMSGMIETPALAKQSANIVRAKNYIEKVYPDVLSEASILPETSDSFVLANEMRKLNNKVTVGDVNNLVNMVKKDFELMRQKSKETAEAPNIKTRENYINEANRRWDNEYNNMIGYMEEVNTNDPAYIEAENKFRQSIGAKPLEVSQTQTMAQPQVNQNNEAEKEVASLLTKARDNGLNSLTAEEETKVTSFLTNNQELSPQLQELAISVHQGQNTVEKPSIDGKIENKANTVKTLPEMLVSDRNFDNVKEPSVKPISQTHAELKPYIQQEANILLGELKNGIKGGIEPVKDAKGYTAGWTGNKRHMGAAIETIRNVTKAPYDRIEKALEQIASGKVRNVNSLAKRIELIIDERLSNGYAEPYFGEDIPANREYISTKNKIEGKEVIDDGRNQDKLQEQDSESTEDRGGSQQAVESRGAERSGRNDGGIKQEARGNIRTFSQIKEEIRKTGFNEFDGEVILPKTDYQKNIVEFAKSLGVDATFYKSSDGPDGIYNHNNPGQVFIRTGSDNNILLHSTGHEFLHSLKINYPDYFNFLISLLKKENLTESRTEFLKTITNEKLSQRLSYDNEMLFEEILADEVGNNFVSRDFWNKVAEVSPIDNGNITINKLLDKVNSNQYETFVGDNVSKGLTERLVTIVNLVQADVYEKTESQITEDEWVEFSFRTKHVKEKFQKEVEMQNVLASSMNWKNVSTLRTRRETPERVFEMVMGKDAKQMIKKFIDPVHKKVAEMTRWVKKEFDEIDALGIKGSVYPVKSKMAALVQMYGEGEVVEVTKDKDALNGKPYDRVTTRQYTLEDLKKDAPKDWQKIKHAAEVIREKYDNYLKIYNEALVRNGYEPMKARKDYFRHMKRIGTAFDLLGQLYNLNDLPTTINGVTDDFVPGKQFFSSELPRLGEITEYDAINGIKGYLKGAANVIFLTDEVTRFRVLETALRDHYSPSRLNDLLDGVAQLSLDEAEQAQKEEEIKKLFELGNTHLSNFVSWLREYTNTELAGKKARVDRALIEEFLGRKGYSLFNAYIGQIGSGMISFNLGAALTNTIPIAHIAATSSKPALLRALMETGANIFHRDGFIEKSDFLTSRLMDANLVDNAFKYISEKGGIPMQALDWFTSNVVVRTKYHELIAKGKTPDEAINEADDHARRMMADRSKGSKPIMFNSKALAPFTMFQLEVNNQLSFLLKDIPKHNYTDEATWKFAQEIAKSKPKLYNGSKAAWVLLQLMIYSFAYNELFELIVGKRPALDPIGIAKASFKRFNNPQMNTNKAAGELLKDIAGNIPFVGSYLGGGRIPMSQATPNLINVAYGKANIGDEAAKLGNILVPGYSQIKKTKDGIKEFNNNIPGVYGKNSAGKYLKIPVKDNLGNRIQALLFGQYASKEAREYFDNKTPNLTVNETKAVEKAKDQGKDYDKVYNSLILSKQIKSIENKIDDTAKDTALSKSVKALKIAAYRAQINEIKRSVR